MEIRVLGPVEVWHEGKSLDLARRQQRLILGILALTPNTLVSSDRLIDLLWGDRPPQKARAITQSRISELRAAIRNNQLDGEVQVLTSGTSYQLQIPAKMVDANQFRQIMDTWRDAKSDEEARLLLRRALSLWRGPMLGGYLTRSSHAALCQTLESGRLAAAENLFEIELRLANHHQVVDEICELADANPSRERLVGQMMLALHRTGRTAEALRKYDRWRRLLAKELGVDPGNELQQLHVAILQGDGDAAPGSRSSSSGVANAMSIPQHDQQERTAHEGSRTGFALAVPRILPPDIGDFTGRTQEIAVIRQLLTRPGSQSVAVVAITGRGGVGKTALSIHVAHSLSKSFLGGQLYVNLRAAGDGDSADPYVVVGRFLRALGVDGSAIPNTLGDRVDLYRDLLFDRNVLIVLDNASSDEQVLPLIPGSPSCGVIVNGRAHLGATFGAHVLSLDVLGPSEAIRLLSQIAGTPRIAADPRAAADLCRQCGYLPLAVRIAAAKLSARPHWTVSKLVDMLTDERSRLDQLMLGQLDVRASIALSYTDLEPMVKRLLLRLADTDLPEISVWISAALLDTDCETAEDLLEQLFDAQLVDVVGYEPTGHSRARLHDLVRLFAKERAATDEPDKDLESARFRVYGAWLFMADEAHNIVDGGYHQGMRGAMPRWPIDDQIVDCLVSEPHRWLDVERQGIVATVRTAASHGQAAAVWELVSQVFPLFHVRRYFDDLTECLGIALAAVRLAQDRRGEAVMLYRLGMICIDRTDYSQARQHFDAAAELFEDVGDDDGCATVKAFTAVVDRCDGDDTMALTRYKEALSVLSKSPDRGGEAFVLRGIGQIYLARGDYEMADMYIDHALNIYGVSGGRQAAAARFWHGMVRLKQNRTSDAEAAFREALAASRAIGDRAGEGQSLRGLGLCFQAYGDLDRARETLLDALRIVQQPGPTVLESHILQAIDGLRS